jgi:hypothetical protein
MLLIPSLHPSILWPVDSMRSGQNNGKLEPIEISPAPDLYLVEFTLGRQPNERISILLPATCGLAAMTGAWELFPEYRRNAKRTHVHAVKYVEIDWQDGRTIIVKQERRPEVPPCVAAEAKPERKKLPRLEDEGGVQ